MIKPTEDLIESKKEFSDICNNIADANKSFSRTLGVSGINIKYHNRIQELHNIIALNILFKNATHKYTLTQKHKVLENSIGNKR